MAAILNSAMLDSDTAILDSNTLLYSLRFTQKHSSSTLTLTQTHSFSPNLMMATILNSAILDSANLHKTLTQTNSNSLNLIYSYLTFWWQPSCIPPSWILPSWIQPFCSKLWLQLIQSDPKSFIHTQRDDGNHIEFCPIGFSHFVQKKLQSIIQLNLMMAAILNSAMLDSDTAILDSNTLLSSLRFTQKHSSSTVTLTQTNSILLTRWWQP